MRYRCRQTTEPARHTLSVRTRTSVTELPSLFETIYSRIAAYLADLGEEFDGAPFAAYYNLDMDDLDVEIGFPVRHSIRSKEEIASGMISGGKAATLLYTGPYTDMEPAYEALLKWMAEQGLTGNGVVYEYYLDDPAETPRDQLRTRIVFPLTTVNSDQDANQI